MDGDAEACLEPEVLESFRDGGLCAQARESAQRHMEGCLHCTRKLLMGEGVQTPQAVPVVTGAREPTRRRDSTLAGVVPQGVGEARSASPTRPWPSSRRRR